VGDALRLKQILTNLLANAVKFTDSGEVNLQVVGIECSARQATLRFFVRDSGIGIAPELQERLFSPFVQADVSTTRRFGGTGLGLSIVKNLVELLGGEIRLSSTVAKGSEFRFDLTFGLSQEQYPHQEVLPSSTQDGSRLLGVHVLVVDDSDINQEVAQRILELEGAQISLASHGEEAVRSLQAGAGAIDVVLMDVQMPVMDGYDATRRIRTIPGMSSLPIIALTAGALTSERPRARAAGMDDFLSKPFDATILVNTICRFVDRAGRPQRSRAAGASIGEADRALAWPDIAGIDTDDVRERLGGDVVLFRSLLRRFIKEFSAAEFSVALDDSPSRHALAARLHKFGGTSGILGARAISRNASLARNACQSGETAGARSHLGEIIRLVTALQRDTAAYLAEEPADVALGTVAGSDPNDGARVQKLIELLRGQSLSAAECFKDCSPALRRDLGEQAFARLRGHVQGLQFREALDTLAASPAS
jgi:CheY-like chemotaxis protein